MFSWVIRPFIPSGMIKPKQRLGALPSAGQAYGDVIRIAGPAILEMVMIATIGIVDMTMVGELGPAAIAAIGLTTQPRMLFTLPLSALTVAITTIIAQKKGEENAEEARLCLRQSIILAVIFSAVLSVFAIVFAPEVMVFSGAKDDALSLATQYFRLIMLSFAIYSISLMISAAQRGVGATKFSLQINVTANVVNVILNYLLIGGHFGFPALGIAGAGIASSIGLTCGTVVALFSLRKKESFLHLSLRDKWKFDGPMLRKMSALGNTALLEQAGLRVGGFLYARILAELGTVAFASYQIMMNLLSLALTFGDGLGVAATSLSGQNIGKKRPDLALMYGKATHHLALAVSVLFILFFYFCRMPLISLFTDDQHLMAITASTMALVCVAVPMFLSQPVTSGVLRGAGDLRMVAITMVVSITLVRPITAGVFIFGFDFGLLGAWFSVIVDQFIRGPLLLSRFLRGKWMKT